MTTIISLSFPIPMLRRNLIGVQEHSDSYCNQKNTKCLQENVLFLVCPHILSITVTPTELLTKATCNYCCWIISWVNVGPISAFQVAARLEEYSQFPQSAHMAAGCLCAVLMSCLSICIPVSAGQTHDDRHLVQFVFWANNWQLKEPWKKCHLNL